MAPTPAIRALREGREVARRASGRPRNYDGRMSAAAPRLPGEELLDAGVADLRAGRESEAALVVEIAAPRLRALGYDIPVGGGAPMGREAGGESSEHRLYALLVRDHASGAHSRYNALLARIASFARAAGHAPAG